MDSFLDGFTIWNAAALIASALLIGLNKTGIPGIGLLPVLLLTMTFPTRLSTGLQLGMLCMADVIAVIWYRRNANWRLILRLIPAAAAGLLAGTLLVNQLNDRTMAVTIGIIVLFLCGISLDDNIRKAVFFKNNNRCTSCIDGHVGCFVNSRNFHLQSLV